MTCDDYKIVWLSTTVAVDCGRLVILRHGRDVTLTRRAWNILMALLDNRGLVLSTDALIHAGWGDELDHTADELYHQIRRIRLAIEDDPSAPRILLNRREFGYVLQIPAEGAHLSS